MKVRFSALVLVCAVGVALSSCRKEEPRVLFDLEELNIPVSCTNGVYDQGEWYIDCGGDCGPCNNPTVPCSIPSNGLLIDGQTYTMNVNCVENEDDFVLSGSAAGYTVLFTVPNLTGQVNLGFPGVRDEGTILSEINVQLQFDGFTLNTQSGSIYVSYDDGMAIVEVCDITVSANVGFSTISRTFSAQIKCNI